MVRENAADQFRPGHAALAGAAIAMLTVGVNLVVDWLLHKTAARKG